MGNCTGKTKQAKENQPHPQQRPHSGGDGHYTEESPQKSWSELHKAELKARREEEAKQGVHHHHHEGVEDESTFTNNTLAEHRPPPINNPQTFSGVR
jgi:hypothetical protein